MAGRIRTIKPEVLEDEKAALLSDEAWRLWVSLWVLVDDYGNARAGERYLAAQVWQDTGRKTHAPLVELIKAGFLIPYSVAGQHYVSVKAWSKHQRINNAGQARVPDPSEDDGQWLQELSVILAENGRQSPRVLKRNQSASKASALPPTSDPDPDQRPTTPTGSAAPLPVPPSDPPTGDVQAPGPTPSPVERRVFDHYVAQWRAVIGGRRYPVYTPKRGALVKSRLAEGFTEDDLRTACEGLFRSSFHLGVNKDSKRYVDFELVMRDAKHVEQFLETHEETETPPVATTQPEPEGPPFQPSPEQVADFQKSLDALGMVPRNPFLSQTGTDE